MAAVGGRAGCEDTNTSLRECQHGLCSRLHPSASRRATLADIERLFVIFAFFVVSFVAWADGYRRASSSPVRTCCLGDREDWDDPRTAELG
jgi:hypothetical protein